MKIIFNSMFFSIVNNVGHEIQDPDEKSIPIIRGSGLFKYK